MAPQPELTGPAAETRAETFAASSVPATGGMYSPDSELGWERYLAERLSAELKRAASFDQDLVLLLACVDGIKRNDSSYQELSRLAQEFFNFQLK